MSTNKIKVTIVMVCILALTIPSKAGSAAGETPPFAGAPECLDTNGDGHAEVTDNPDYGKYPDYELYHDLWNEQDGCHYNHEHGDLPDLANKYFGEPGALWGGQTIAYPFTSSATENVHKHDGFKWVVRTPEYHPWPPCGTREENDLLIDHSDFCVVAVRAQLHNVSGLMAVATRFHSGFTEVYGCKPPYAIPQDCGTFKMGSSLIDWGQPRAPFYQTFRPRPLPGYNQPTFTIDFGNGMGKGVVMDFKTDTSDLPGFSGQPYINIDEYSESNLASYRSIVPRPGDFTIVEQWSSNDFDCEPRMPGEPCHNRYFRFLYHISDAWALLDTNDMRIPRFICEVGKPCHYNGSLTGLNEAGIWVLPEWDIQDGIQDGRVTWSGYTDRFGNPRTDSVCTTPGFDCVPFEMVNIPVGVGHKTDERDCDCSAWEHDIYFNGQPSGWIQFSPSLALKSPGPTNTPPPTEPPPSGPFVSTEVNPTSLDTGGTALVSINLNNVPVEGYKSAEFTCSYDAVLVEKSDIAATSLFGVDPVVAIHDLQGGEFIVAIAGTNSNRATTNGPAFTFQVKGLQAGQSQIQCTARVSKGDNVPIDLPSTGASLAVLEMEPSPTSTPPAPPTITPSLNGLLNGQILAGKPVTVTLLDANNEEVMSVTANSDGSFSLPALAGNYTVIAEAMGFLDHQGSVTISAGTTTVLPISSLLAGDVDGNNVIDQFDALTIGMNYTSSTPVAADLNNDGVIDFLDLELLAENYRSVGPTVWE